MFSTSLLTPGIAFAQVAEVLEQSEDRPSYCPFGHQVSSAPRAFTHDGSHMAPSRSFRRERLLLPLNICKHRMVATTFGGLFFARIKGLSRSPRNPTLFASLLSDTSSYPPCLLSKGYLSAHTPPPLRSLGKKHTR